MSDPRPIGMLDSGIGGLTVAKEVFRAMPGESVIYFGDTARCPYGGRSKATITTYGAQGARFLLGRDIKMLIVACNTLSSVALDAISNEAGDIPVIGVVLPGVRAAINRTMKKKIGVLGTTATIESGAYEKAVRNIDPGIKTYMKPSPLFVPLLEEGFLDTDIMRLAVQRSCSELVASGVDCLVLGCTHYPLLMEHFQGTLGAGVQVLDSALWTAKEARDILFALGALAKETVGGMEKSEYFVSDVIPELERKTSFFMGSGVENITKIELKELTK